MIKLASWAEGGAFCEGTGERRIFRNRVSHTVVVCVRRSSLHFPLVLTIMADSL